MSDKVKFLDVVQNKLDARKYNIEGYFHYLYITNVKPVEDVSSVLKLDYKETLVNNSYTEMAEEKRKKLILFCNKQIDIDMLIGLKEETTTEPIIQEAPKQIITTSDVLEDLL